MSEIIGIIAIVEDDEYQGKAHKKVTLEDGQVLKVKYGREGALKAKWDLLIEGTAIKFTMQEYTNPTGVKFPFVSDIATVEGELPAPKPPAPLSAEQQAEIAKATKKEHNPQEVGLAYKILAEMYIAGFIDENKADGKELVLRLKMWLKEVLLP